RLDRHLVRGLDLFLRRAAAGAADRAGDEERRRPERASAGCVLRPAPARRERIALGTRPRSNTEASVLAFSHGTAAPMARSRSASALSQSSPAWMARRGVSRVVASTGRSDVSPPCPERYESSAIASTSSAFGRIASR